MATQVSAGARTVAPAEQRTFLGHPVGLYILFFTEMWERFSFYGMRGLLVLYMLNYFKMSQHGASSIYKWYSSLVYLTPLIGGYLADRFLGNKRAVIIGAILMAIGHFLMAFEPLTIFYSALIFLIIGNGFFKPNMSTQVGRLYPKNDGRRDGAYTIFYMGINLGAFLSPIVCGWLAEHTLGSYHSGFTMAGIGMVLGLVIYLVGQPWVKEIDHQPAQPAAHGKAQPTDENGEPTPRQDAEAAISEEAAERTPSAMPAVSRLSPLLMAVLGGLVILASAVIWLPGIEIMPWESTVALGAGGVCLLIGAWVLSKTHQAVRDRVLAIYVLGLFVIFFWAAFEQGGNALNQWADKVTRRQVSGDAAPPLFPAVPKQAAGEGVAGAPESGWSRWTSMFRLKESTAGGEEGGADEGFVIPTTWFLSINALAIFVLAPIFAAMWTKLDRVGWNPSIPSKMAFGLLFMALSMAVMAASAKVEDKPSSAPLKADRLPPQVGVNGAGQLYHRGENGEQAEPPYDAGRLVYDAEHHRLDLKGVLSDLERDRIARDTAPPDFVKQVKELREKSEAAEGKVKVSVKLDKVPPGFDWRYTGLSKSDVTWDPGTQTLTAHRALADKDVKTILVAGGSPQLRDSLNQLMVESARYRVSPWWLFWSYILATIGELCLSPVGLSMTSKLAPARFATMLMGMWLMTNFFGNFVAGAFGEMWGTVAPVPFFLTFIAMLGVASLVLFVLVRKIVTIMHGVT
jgi:POT family proton-dependent oligopeptide transporter